MENNPRSIRVHETGKKHMDNAEKQRLASRDARQTQEKEEERLRSMMAEIERKAAAAYAKDMGQEEPSTKTHYPSDHRASHPKSYTSHAVTQAAPSATQVPVSSGCYCGADGVYYYYDAASQCYSVVDAAWAQQYISTYGVLQFASSGSSGTSDHMQITNIGRARRTDRASIRRHQ